jgi:hypothetical protein
MNVPPDHSLPEIFHRQKLCRRAKVLGLKVDDESLVGRQRKRTLVEARHCCSWAHSRRSLHLHIENTELQPLASAFFKLPNLVCGRSESPLTALSAKMCLPQHRSVWAQTNRSLRSAPRPALLMAKMAVPLIRSVTLTGSANPRGRHKPGKRCIPGQPHPIDGPQRNGRVGLSRCAGVGDLHRRSNSQLLACAACIGLAGWCLSWHKPSSTSTFMWIKL